MTSTPSSAVTTASTPGTTSRGCWTGRGIWSGGRRQAQCRRRRSKRPSTSSAAATAKWDYLDAEGKLLAVVYRYDPPGGKKEFRPWDAKRKKMAPPTRGRSTTSRGWSRRSKSVLVEGEKCAQALIDAGVVATTAMHGANAPVDKTDWSPLAGKAVLIWPDKDKPGWDYATRAAEALLARRRHLLRHPLST